MIRYGGKRLPTANVPSMRRLKAMKARLERLRARIEDLEDLRDLDAAIARNGNKPLIPWETVKAELGL